MSRRYPQKDPSPADPLTWRHYPDTVQCWCAKHAGTVVTRRTALGHAEAAGCLPGLFIPAPDEQLQGEQQEQSASEQSAFEQSAFEPEFDDGPEPKVENRSEVSSSHGDSSSSSDGAVHSSDNSTECDSDSTSDTSADDVGPDRGGDGGERESNPARCARQTKESRDNPLFPGARLTVLLACFLLLDVLHRGNLPQQSMRDVWDVVSLMLPEGHILPPYSLAVDLLTDMSDIGYTTYDVCQDDCVIFRDRLPADDPNSTHQHAACTHCPNPNCKKPRFKPDGKPFRTFSWLGINSTLSKRLWFDEWRDAVALTRLASADSVSVLDTEQP